MFEGVVLVADPSLRGQRTTKTAEAARWYRLAAEQGDERAQSNLGLMYDTGRGVLQDIVLAHMWFNIASANGNEFATENRAFAVEKMTREQIADAQTRARVCMSEVVAEFRTSC